MPHQSRELCFTWAIFAGSSTPSSASGKSQICHTEDEKFAIIERDFANTVLRNKCTVNLWVTLREMKKAHYTQPVSVWQGQNNLCQVPSLQALPKTMEEEKQTNIESVQSSYSKSAWLAWKHKNLNATRGAQNIKDCSHAQMHSFMFRGWSERLSARQWLHTLIVALSSHWEHPSQHLRVVLKETPQGLSHLFWRGGYRKFSLFTVASTPTARDKQLPATQTALHTWQVFRWHWLFSKGASTSGNQHL